MLSVNFQEQELDQFISKIRSVAILTFTFTSIYMMEIGSRYNSTNPLALVHHVVSIIDGLFVVFFPTIVMVKTASVLEYFIWFESLTFNGLVMYRLCPQSNVTPRVMVAGMICFGATRPVQLVWVFASIFGSWNDNNIVKWQGILQICVTLIVTTIQIFSLKIHYSVWKRCLAKQMNVAAKKSNTKNSVTWGAQDDDDLVISRTKHSIEFEDTKSGKDVKCPGHPLKRVSKGVNEYVRFLWRLPCLLCASSIFT